MESSLVNAARNTPSVGVIGTSTGMMLSPQPIFAPLTPLSLIAIRNILTVLAPEVAVASGDGLVAEGIALATGAISLGAGVTVIVTGTDVCVGINVLVGETCVPDMGVAVAMLQAAWIITTAKMVKNSFVPMTPPAVVNIFNIIFQDINLT